MRGAGEGGCVGSTWWSSRSMRICVHVFLCVFAPGRTVRVALLAERRQQKVHHGHSPPLPPPPLAVLLCLPPSIAHTVFAELALLSPPPFYIRVSASLSLCFFCFVLLKQPPLFQWWGLRACRDGVCRPSGSAHFYGCGLKWCRRGVRIFSSLPASAPPDAEVSRPVRASPERRVDSQTLCEEKKTKEKCL